MKADISHAAGKGNGQKVQYLFSKAFHNKIIHLGKGVTMKKEMNELIGNSEFYQHIRKHLGEPSHINLETLTDINVNLHAC